MYKYETVSKAVVVRFVGNPMPPYFCMDST